MFGHDEMWRYHAACAGATGELAEAFFPEDGHHEQSQRAKAVCARCPVVDDCLAYALDNFIRDGIWGGTSLRQREILWRQRRSDRDRDRAS